MINCKSCNNFDRFVCVNAMSGGGPKYLSNRIQLTMNINEDPYL